MTRTMYDSVNAARLPAGGDLYLAYVDGRYANVDQVRARFPNTTVVPITVLGSDGANVADCETGDLTPSSSVTWVRRRRAAGADPTVYCTYGAWATVRAAFHNAGEPEPHWFIAKYDNDPTLMAGAVAKQYGGNIAGNYDASTVADYWPGVDEGDDMYGDPDRARDNLMAKQVQEIHDALYKGHPEDGQEGIEGNVAEIHQKLLGTP